MFDFKYAIFYKSISNSKIQQIKMEPRKLPSFSMLFSELKKITFNFNKRTSFFVQQQMIFFINKVIVFHIESTNQDTKSRMQYHKPSITAQIPSQSIIQHNFYPSLKMLSYFTFNKKKKDQIRLNKNTHFQYERPKP